MSKFAGVPAGANEIRNLGPIVNGTAERRPPAITVSREDLSSILGFRWSFRDLPSANGAGTDGATHG
jgi:hypothetical protein